MTSNSEPAKSIEQIETEFEHVEVLLGHLRLKWLLRHFPVRLVWSAYVGIAGFVTIALLALLALVTGSPFVFPSLGPTAYLFFFMPKAVSASPRNAILGHAIGLICGYAAYTLTGASGAGMAIQVGIHQPELLSAALSMAVTGALMVLFKVSHPPAGATTLIVSLGIISRPRDLVIIEVAVVLLAVQAIAINRLAGLPYPLWRGSQPASIPRV